MSVACVILHYRNLDDTLDCLGSLRDAGIAAAEWKVFLINNSAEDGSVPLLENTLAAAGIVHSVVIPGKNLGFARGCNLGADKALSEGFSHVLLLNNDTLVAQDFRKEVERAIADSPETVIAGTVTDADGQPTHNIGNLSPWTGRVRHIFAPVPEAPIDFVSGCLMIVPSEILRKIGLFDEQLFMYGEDADFCMRLSRKGFGIRHVPTIRVKHKFNPTVSRTGLPKEYYIQRNLAYVVLRRGTWLQRFLFPWYLLAMPFYKLVRRPKDFRNAVRGGWDGVRGRMGVRLRST